MSLKRGSASRDSRNSEQSRLTGTTSMAGTELELGATQVFAGVGVDEHLIPFIQEQRHVDDFAGFQRRGLGAAGGGVTLEAGVGAGDRERDGGGELHADRLG